MEFSYPQGAGKEWTDNPRALTEAEKDRIRHLPYIEAVKEYRKLTDATLAAAVRNVKTLSNKA